MKKIAYILLIPLLIGTSSGIQARDYDETYLGLPGDNLNLFAVMKLFQESETLEGFERSLNAENSRINNLDLNGDNRIDYIRVIDNPEKDFHFIVLQVAINARENQDVAVFIVNRETNNQVRIQLIGDESLYGKDYIVEPNYDANGYNETPNPGYTGNTRFVEGQTVTVNRVTTYEVAAWPLVRFIFLPGYMAWHSPWYWGYYPQWWSPWRPYYWHYYYGFHYNCYPHYYGYYRHTNYHQYHNHWDTYYYGSRRNYSPYVSAHIQTGSYKTTYSRPESRRAGSDLYNRTHTSANSRTATRASGNSQVKSTSTRTIGNSEYGRRDVSSRNSWTDNNNTAVRSNGSTTGRSVNRSSENTVDKATKQAHTSGTSLRSETRTSAPSDRRISSHSSHMAPEAATSRPSTSNSANTKSSVKTESRRPSSSQDAGNHSSSRKPAGSAQVKSRNGAPSSVKETADGSKSNSTGRR